MNLTDRGDAVFMVARESLRASRRCRSTQVRNVKVLYHVTGAISFVNEVPKVIEPVLTRRPAVLRRLHFIQTRRLRESRSWVVSLSNSRPFGLRA